MVKAEKSERPSRRLVREAADNYGRQLHAFLRRRVGRPEDVDDLAQEVYLRLLRVNREEAVRKPLAYIYGVARHVVSEFHMRGGKVRVVFDSDTAEAAVDVASDAPAGATGALAERQVSEALQQLSDRHLAVLLLERRDGLNHQQVAARLGLSVHTVKKYSVQALAQVRASLEP